MQSVVKTRRRNIGKSTEHVNDDPDMESFTSSLAESQSINSQNQEFTDVPLLVAGDRISSAGNDQDQDQQAASQTDGDADSNDDKDDNGDEEMTDDNLDSLEEEALPADINTSNDAESHQAVVERMNPDTDSKCEFRKILDHCWKDGTLFLKAQHTDDIQGTFEIDTPFKKLKLDEPLACAKFIRECMPETGRGERPMNKWADEVIKQHAQTTRRMMQVQPDSVHLNSPNTTAKATRRMFQQAMNLAKLHHQINMMRI